VHQRNRRLAIATVTTSAMTVIGTLGTGVIGQQVVQAATPAAVTFTSSPFVAPLVAHYTVTPEQRSGEGPTAASGGSSQDQLPDLNIAKHPGASALARSAVRSSSAATTTSTSTAGPGDSAPRASSSFIGQQGSSVTCSYFAQGCNPPDMALGASSNFVLQGVNTQWEVLSTTGKVQSDFPVSAQSFFNVPNVSNGSSPCDTAHNSQPFLSDPRALYDPADGRFWAAMLQIEGAPGFAVAPDCPFKSVYYIAVSQTSDPRGSWNVYEFDMAAGANFGADYTQVGFNSDGFFFSANMFERTVGFYGYAEVVEANKAQMEAGKANFTADGFRNLRGTGPGTTAQTGPFLADTVQPVQTIGGQGGNGQARHGGGADGLFVDTIDGPDLLNGHFCTSAADACKGLALWRMSDPIGHDHGGAAPTLTGTYLPNTQPFFVTVATPTTFSSPGDQPSCHACIDGLDLRITTTPVLRNNTIYAAWETGHYNGTQTVPTIEWAQVSLDGHSPSSTSAYFGFGGDTSASFGGLMPDAQGNVVMVYERMSHTIFPEVRFTVRRADQANFTDAGRLLKAAEASYRPSLCGTPALPICRWGDYNATSTDGAGHIWFAGEYANSNTNPSTPPAFGRNWGTWIGAVSTQDRAG
jgi:hypothetical protein